MKRIKPKIFILIILIIGFIGVLVHFTLFGHEYKEACAYLEKRVAQAEKQSKEDITGNVELYSKEEVDEIIEMFKDIKLEGNCYKQYQKFQNHLKQHPLKGGNNESI